jgi:hypothetical protein
VFEKSPERPGMMMNAPAELSKMLQTGQSYILFIKCVGIFPGVGIDFKDRYGNVYTAIDKENPDLYMEWTDQPVATDQLLFKHNDCILLTATITYSKISPLHLHKEYIITNASILNNGISSFVNLP